RGLGFVPRRETERARGGHIIGRSAAACAARRRSIARCIVNRRRITGASCPCHGNRSYSTTDVFRYTISRGRELESYFIRANVRDGRVAAIIVKINRYAAQRRAGVFGWIGSSRGCASQVEITVVGIGEEGA